jgi:hypothetical protein
MEMDACIYASVIWITTAGIQDQNTPNGWSKEVID